MKDIVLTHDNGEVFTTSLLIAEKFGKRHDTVLRKIQKFPDADFGLRNFAESSYLNEQGKNQPRRIMHVIFQ